MWSGRLIAAAAASFLGGCSALTGLDDFDANGRSQGGAAGMDDAGGMGGAGGDSPTGGSPIGGGGGAVTGGGGAGGTNPCGDGTIDQDEECDDANTSVGDGCDNCVVECPGTKNPTTFHCYVYQSSGASWGASEAACNARGPGWHLAALSTSDEAAYLHDIDIIANQCWLGGQDVNGDNAFGWTNGETWDFAPWYGSNPDSGVQCLTNFLLSSASTDGFVDRPCAESWPRLCELTPAGVPPQ